MYDELVVPRGKWDGEDVGRGGDEGGGGKNSCDGTETGLVSPPPPVV